MNAKVVTKQKWKYGLGNENFSIFSGEVVIAHTVGCDIYTDGENAARIVRAVNSHDDMLAALQQAVRYIEVSIAYKGAMTAAEVECQIIANRNISMTEIAANSCCTLASFEIEEARAAIERATKG